MRRKVIRVLHEIRLRIIAFVATLLRIDLLHAAHNRMGILKFREDESGEDLFIENILTQLLPTTAVMFDVGANVGDYSRKLAVAFPKAKIISFEPNPACVATAPTSEFNNIRFINFAVGETQSTCQLQIPCEGTTSEHSSMYHGVLGKVHGYADFTIMECEMVCLDEFCCEENINCVDFLKIDTEGHELSVLKGAQRILREHRLKIVQFEFNEMNVYSRVFLKDFFELLNGFRMYRLDTRRLIPIEYDPRQEIFQYQNIIAICQRNFPDLSLDAFL